MTNTKMLVVARFALFFHHATESLVLAVRGTSSIKDAISDLMADEVSFLEIGKFYKTSFRCLFLGGLLTVELLDVLTE